MASSKILIQHATILSVDATVGDFERGDILIEGTKIKAVGIDLDIPEGANIINGSDCIVIPGFVDCHRHSWEGALRLIHPDSKMLGEYFDAALGGFRSSFRPEDVYAGTLATAMSCLDVGITTVIDNMHCLITQDHGKAAIDAWNASGVGAIVAVEQTPWGERSSASTDEIKVSLSDLQKHVSEKKNSSLNLAIFGQNYDAEYTAAKELRIRVIVEIIADFSAGWIASAHEKGHLDSSVTFNHVTSMPASDWEIIRETDARVNVCPRSDAQWALADGVCAYQDAVAYGIYPGISIDNEIAYGGDMFSEMKTLFTLQRALAARQRYNRDAKAPSPVTVREVLKAATIDGARNCGWEDRIGSITTGKEANLVILRSDDLNVYPAHNAVGTVVLAADRSNVDTVIVGGSIRKQAGRLLDFDLADHRSRMDASLSYLFSKNNYKVNKVSKEFKKLKRSNTHQEGEPVLRGSTRSD